MTGLGGENFLAHVLKTVFLVQGFGRRPRRIIPSEMNADCLFKKRQTGKKGVGS
jgi:hypothetical protein